MNLFTYIKNNNLVETVNCDKMIDEFFKEYDHLAEKTYGWYGEGFPSLPNIELVDFENILFLTTKQAYALLKKEIDNYVGFDHWFGDIWIKDLYAIVIWDEENQNISFTTPETMWPHLFPEDPVDE